MIAEAPDQNHGGPGRVGDGRNGLTGPNIPMHSRDLKEANSIYCFGGLKKVFGAFYVEICKAIE